MIARYADRFVPVSGEGAGTALPVTFHRFSKTGGMGGNGAGDGDGDGAGDGGDDGGDGDNGGDESSRGKRRLKCVVDSTGALRVYFAHRADAFRALGRLMVGWCTTLETKRMTHPSLERLWVIWVQTVNTRH